MSLTLLDEGKSDCETDFLSDYSGFLPGLYEPPKEKKRLPWQAVILVAIAAILLVLVLRIFFFEKNAAWPGFSTFFSLPGEAADVPEDIQLSVIPVVTENPAQAETETDVFLPPAMMTKLPFEVSELMRSSYRDPALRDWTLGFFHELTGSYDVASEVLASACAHGVNPALAFSLCEEESSYNPNAINSRNRNGTIDRGLFQG